MENKIPLLVIAGPTASGKTACAVELAKIYDGEIVSADSMQIYKGLSIATAKPTKEEMQGVPHYLIDFLEPEQAFSVADYVKLAYQRDTQPWQSSYSLWGNRTIYKLTCEQRDL